MDFLSDVNDVATWFWFCCLPASISDNNHVRVSCDRTQPPTPCSASPSRAGATSPESLCHLSTVFTRRLICHRKQQGQKN